MVEDYGHWDIELVGEFESKDFFGFIYEIKEIETGKTYIGRKIFRNKTKKANNWRTYTSSSEEVNGLIKEIGKEKFVFRIVLLCAGKSQLTYEEERLQFENDVLRVRLPNGDRKYFNKTIGYRRFNGVEKQTEKARQLMAERMRVRMTGVPKTKEHRENISKARIGMTFSETHRENLSKSGTGRVFSETHRGKLRKVQTGRRYNSETNSKKGVTPDVRWWTDGTSNKRSVEQPDKGWALGRTLKKDLDKD
jgi:hypothetical protein